VRAVGHEAARHKGPGLSPPATSAPGKNASSRTAPCTGDHAGSDQAGFAKERHKRRSEVERSGAVATRYDKRADVFTGTVTPASARLWLRP
jgi:hypothetical protein